MYKHILAATDGSDLAEKAFTRASQLAKAMGARLTLAHVGMPYVPPLYTGDFVPSVLLSPDEHESRVNEAADKVLTRARSMCETFGLQADTAFVIDEQPYQALIDLANERGCDLVVMASHGRRGLSAVLLGSETQKLLTHSTIDTLVIR